MKNEFFLIMVVLLCMAIVLSCGVAPDNAITPNVGKTQIPSNTGTGVEEPVVEEPTIEDPDDPPPIEIEYPEDLPPVVIEEPAELPAIIEEEAELVEVSYNPLSSAYSGIITMGDLNENVVFICTVDNGVLARSPRDPEEPLYAKNRNAHSGYNISWVSREWLDGGAWVDQAFIEIVLKLEQNIIGYVVIKANTTITTPRSPCPLFILKSVLFPQIDGKYQNVSEEYVNAAIEKVKYGSNEEEALLVNVRPYSASGAKGAITMLPLGKDVVFICTVDNGLLGKVFPAPEGLVYVKNQNAHSRDEIIWTNRENPEQPIGLSQAFIEIVLKFEQNIIGYVVINANLSSRPLVILRSALFPQIDGKYQNISEADVKAAIKRVKTSI